MEGYMYFFLTDLVEVFVSYHGADSLCLGVRNGFYAVFWVMNGFSVDLNLSYISVAGFSLWCRVTCNSLCSAVRNRFYAAFWVMAVLIFNEDNENISSLKLWI